jgi:hypothetical protein
MVSDLAAKINTPPALANAHATARLNPTTNAASLIGFPQKLESI